MSVLAIKGHVTRGKEVIEILEMLGGSNPHNYYADCDSLCFTIGKGTNIIYYDWVKKCYEDEDTLVFTLEEFFAKFPYKVGDKVRVAEYESEVRIDDMKWDGNEVQYEVFTDMTEWYSAEELNLFNEPDKEETMESKPNLLQQLKEYFENTPRDVLEKEWNELSYLNEIGPTVDEYLELVKKYRQSNQYPKTYEECCKIIYSDPKFYVDTHLYSDTLGALYKLLICRDAYCKIAGEQMGLGKPWKPDWTNNYQKKWTINFYQGEINLTSGPNVHFVLAFPTKEMRDAFYENFKDLIIECMELL